MESGLAFPSSWSAPTLIRIPPIALRFWAPTPISPNRILLRRYERRWRDCLLLRNSLLLAPIFLGALWAQEKPAGGQVDLQLILNRLDALEQENQKLLEEIHSLRAALIESRAASNSPSSVSAAASQTPPAVPQPSLEDRVAVAEQRIREQAQTKVESAHKFPVTLTGMLLFNAFMNSRSPDTVQAAAYQDLLSGPAVPARRSGRRF